MKWLWPNTSILLSSNSFIKKRQIKGQTHTNNFFSLFLQFFFFQFLYFNVWRDFGLRKAHHLCKQIPALTVCPSSQQCKEQFSPWLVSRKITSCVSSSKPTTKFVSSLSSMRQTFIVYTYLKKLKSVVE